MDQTGILRFLRNISVHYPTFKRTILDDKGNVPMFVIDEWSRLIGFLSYEEAVDRLDNWMLSENGSRIPKPMDLRKQKSRTYEEFQTSRKDLRWHLEFLAWDTDRLHGRLRDQEEREYVHDPLYEDGYHYNQMGQICTIDGSVVF